MRWIAMPRASASSGVAPRSSFGAHDAVHSHGAADPPCLAEGGEEFGDLRADAARLELPARVVVDAGDLHAQEWTLGPEPLHGLARAHVEHGHRLGCGEGVRAELCRGLLQSPIVDGLGQVDEIVPHRGRRGRGRLSPLHDGAEDLLEGPPRIRRHCSSTSEQRIPLLDANSHGTKVATVKDVNDRRDGRFVHMTVR